MDQLEDLEAEAEHADEQDVARSIDYLAKVWSANRFTWALMGGTAMQKYGMPNRTTIDSDIVISANFLELRDAVVDDEKCAAV